MFVYFPPARLVARNKIRIIHGRECEKYERLCKQESR